MNPARDVAGRSDPMAALRLVRSLVGVAGAALRANAAGRIEAVAVLPAPDAHERQVRLNVASALMAGFGIAIDPAAIAIVDDQAALDAFAPAVPAEVPHVPADAPPAEASPALPGAVPAHRSAASADPAPMAPASADWPAPPRQMPAARPASPAPDGSPAGHPPAIEPAAAHGIAARANGHNGHNDQNGHSGHNGHNKDHAASPAAVGNGHGNGGFPISPPRRVRLAEDLPEPRPWPPPAPAPHAPTASSGTAAPGRAAPPPPPMPHARPSAAPHVPPVSGPPAIERPHHGAPAAPPPEDVIPTQWLTLSESDVVTGDEPSAASPAAPSAARPAPGTGPLPQLEAAELVNARGISFCRVVIVVAGERYTGVTEVPEGQDTTIELIARITADALRSARYPRDPVQYAGAATVDIAGRAYVVAALRAWNGRTFDDLVAVEPIRDAPEDAAAIAVLRAAASRQT